jgi:hypothetical protein
LLVTALCAVTGAALVTAAPTAAAAGVPAGYLNQQINWQTCFSTPWEGLPAGSDKLLCGTITVPMDWHNPGRHKDITIAVSKLAATGRPRARPWSAVARPSSRWPTRPSTSGATS